MEKASWFGDIDFGTKTGLIRIPYMPIYMIFDGYLLDKEGNLRDYHYIFQLLEKMDASREKFEDLSELGKEAFQEVKK